MKQKLAAILISISLGFFTTTAFAEDTEGSSDATPAASEPAADAPADVAPAGASDTAAPDTSMSQSPATEGESK